VKEPYKSWDRGVRVANADERGVHLRKNFLFFGFSA